MFVQHMLSVLKPDLRMAAIMPQGVLFRRRPSRRAPPQRRPRMPRGQGQEFSPPRGHPQDRPRYRARRTVPGYARLVPVEAIAAEDFNCNIRRHVDNARRRDRGSPPPLASYPGPRPRNLPVLPIWPPLRVPPCAPWLNPPRFATTTLPPAAEVQPLKAQIKELRTQPKLAKKEAKKATGAPTPRRPPRWSQNSPASGSPRPPAPHTPPSARGMSRGPSPWTSLPRRDLGS